MNSDYKKANKPLSVNISPELTKYTILSIIVIKNYVKL